MSLSEINLTFPLTLVEKISKGDLETIETNYKDLIWEFANDFNSELTAKAYLGDLRIFFKWTHEKFSRPLLKKDGIEFSGITRSMVISYKKYLLETGGRKGKPSAPLTVIKKLSAIKTFYEYLIEKGIVNNNPADSIRRPRAEIVRETEDFSDNEVIELFELLRNSKSAAKYLHRAVILTLFCTGIRQGALRKLKIENFKFGDGIYYLEYFDKGKKKHKCIVHIDAATAINEYISWMRVIGREHRDDEPLFQPTKNNSGVGGLTKELSATSISYMIRHYAKEIAKDKHITPHSARATLIGSLLSAGKELHKVSKDINHRSPSTTARYDKRGRKLKDSSFLGAGFHIKEENEDGE